MMRAHWDPEIRRRDAQAIRVGKMFARAATRGNLFADTLCARMLRYVMTTGEVEQGALMKELHRIGGKATGFHFAFGRFEGPEGGSLIKRKPIPPKPNPDGTPRMRRVITWNSDINSWTRRGPMAPVRSSRNMVEWVGPTRDEWLRSMTDAELDKAAGRIEHEMLEATDLIDETRATAWRAWINHEIKERPNRG